MGAVPSIDWERAALDRKDTARPGVLLPRQRCGRPAFVEPAEDAGNGAGCGEDGARRLYECAPRPLDRDARL